MNFQTLINYSLIAVNPKNARFYGFGNYYNFGLLGAVLMDLYKNELVEINKNKVVYKGIDSVYPEFLDRAIQLLRSKNEIRIISFFNTFELSIQCNS